MKIFNTKYCFVNDTDRIIIKINSEFSEGTFWGFIHPVYAWILNLSNGKKDDNYIYKIISSRLDISEQTAQAIVKSIDSDEYVYISYNGVISVIPPHVLVESESVVREEYNDETFIIEQPINHTRLRLSKPKNLLICPTLNCFTDCVYCYANKNHKHIEISYELWVQLIVQAKEIGIERIDVTGGEFFLKSGWQKIAQALTCNGYFPDISTKIPLSNSIIDDIAESGLKTVQFSLDTLDPYVAASTLNVSYNYITQFQKSIRYADLKGLKIILKPTLSNKTCNIDNLRSILYFASSLSNISRVVVSIIGFSNFKEKGNYTKIRPSLNQVYAIRSFINEMNDNTPFPIVDDTFIYRKCEMKNNEVFSHRAFCSANVDGFVVLPDGVATICEELYWNPFFQIGKIQKQSIMDIWTSNNAKSLFELNQETYPDNSACKTCQSFTECHTNKGICWKLVIAAYGSDNTLYPDPRCPYAPISNINYTLD